MLPAAGYIDARRSVGARPGSSRQPACSSTQQSYLCWRCGHAYIAGSGGSSRYDEAWLGIYMQRYIEAGRCPACLASSGIKLTIASPGYSIDPAGSRAIEYMHALACMHAACVPD
jgi:hypothetical protein